MNIANIMEESVFVFIISVCVLIAITFLLAWFIFSRINKHKIEVYSSTIRRREMKIEALRQRNLLLNEQNDVLRIATHNVNKKLAALERITIEHLWADNMNGYTAEAASEWSITLEDIRELATEFENEIDKTTSKKQLPKTKITLIDSLFANCLDKCAKMKIEFDVNVVGSVQDMVQHAIPRKMLGTIIGNHLQNAVEAVNMCKGSFRRILVVIGYVKGNYELSISDSGVPFAIGTLIKLGSVRTTTHENYGGNGIGFETTFKITNECMASLIISEKKPTDNDFTKSIIFRFDEKNKYIIRTYRPDEIPESKRYIIEDSTL